MKEQLDGMALQVKVNLQEHSLVMICSFEI